MTNLCGHAREVLIWALSWARDVWANNDTSLRELATMPWSAKNPTRYAVVTAIIDPAKLAEMLAERGRQLGFDASEDALGIGNIAFSTEPDMPYIRLFRGYGRLVDNWYEWRDLDMCQARSLLLKWLHLPDGAREQAEKVLRVAM